ncbi:MAG: glycosyltransferase [Gemmatimonadales bacterium]|nr:MAG: glycosyltransferase [Gemmatimonadales bacterium]
MDPGVLMLSAAPPNLPSAVAWLILALTGFCLAVLVVLGLHRTRLVLLSRRSGPDEPTAWEGALPRVTVQLPIYNEAEVVERLLRAVGELEYPRALLDIQVLDDSTDETRERAAQEVRRLRELGVRAEHLIRSERVGFKAGALQKGMARARGEFILILDADFVPGPGLIRDLLPPFQDPEVGMVQARWDHLNEEAGLLTRCQALLLDAHFFFEQGGRYSGGLFMSFNGTAGMWRRRALEEAGGWSWDTLTEDLDVSYRSQMQGWRFVFRPGVGVPAELPGGVRALEVQQKRWAQGGIQAGRKVLPALLRGPWPLRIRAEGVAHLMGHVAYPLTLLLGILLLPAAVARSSLGLERFLILDLVAFTGASVSFLLIYVAAGRTRKRPFRLLIPRAAATMALGVGLTASVSRAVWRGFRGGGGDAFVRTPKKGQGPGRYRSQSSGLDLSVKAALAGWMALSLALAVLWGYWGSLPFLFLFASGYLWALVAHGSGPLPLGGAPVSMRQAESTP